MAANHTPQGPEGDYDPAGSTQMFRAFVEEAAPVSPTGAGSRRQRREAQAQERSGTPVAKIALVIALVVVIGAVAWAVLR